MSWNPGGRQGKHPKVMDNVTGSSSCQAQWRLVDFQCVCEDREMCSHECERQREMKEVDGELLLLSAVVAIQ